MNLTLKVYIEGEYEAEISPPDDDDILKALSKIEEKSADRHVILARSDLSYMQTDGFVLEYQEGSVDYHCYCPNGFVSADNAAQAFLSYARGDDEWKQAFQWERGFC